MRNKELTRERNLDDGAIRTVNSTGDTVYHVFYDRRDYTFVFDRDTVATGTFNPFIRHDGKIYDAGAGTPYTFTARFGQSLGGLWPSDAEVGTTTENFGEVRMQGWNLTSRYASNGAVGGTVYRDTPPYRLTKDEFIEGWTYGGNRQSNHISSTVKDYGRTPS